MRGAGDTWRQRRQECARQPQPTSRSARRWSAPYNHSYTLFYRIMQFSRQLNPRRTAANDGDIDLTVRAQISRKYLRNRFSISTVENGA